MEENERRRKEEEEYQKAVDRRRKEATAKLERQMPGRFSRSVDIGGLRTAVYNAREAGVARELVQTAEDALREADRDRLVAELRAAMPGMLRGGADLSRLRTAILIAAANGIDVASYRAALQKERNLRHFTSITVPELKEWCLDEGIDYGSFIEKAEYTKALNIRR